ncbi:hypothetical protein H5J25_10250 [Sphingomonas aliaeris]|uniref:Uncharacterized protein n=1 Tax=Sphingomonas aliaeris TaxID=2759526 RepID=A0A974S2V2_9SPHN|nr:hypothetical protein [Sphingomonas aliaeris]QQV75972.1 hypothetical protein H5J25_10250 [Sphingomonas aliaeris]
MLLYLPVVTPWWYTSIIEPIMRRLVEVADVHILAPIPWRNTGIRPEQISSCRDLPQITWHIIDDPGHTDLRFNATNVREDLLSFVRSLAPDLTLCRTADFETAYRFPGIVRFLMEVAATPFYVTPCTSMIAERPFANGVMPELGVAASRRLDDLVDSRWTEMRQHWDATIPDRTVLREALSISDDRPLLLMPLEYDDKENFFNDHYMSTGTCSLAMIREVAEKFAEHWHIVVTDHPLNELYVDRSKLRSAISALGRNVQLSEPTVAGIPATLAVARHANGMVLGNSKSFGLGALFSVPMVRRSAFASADWLACDTDLDRFEPLARTGKTAAPSQSDARRWFAYHLANEAFDPTDPDLSGDDLVDRMTRAVNPDRWDAGMARVLAVKHEPVQ